MALYARVSSDRQDMDLSVASQLRALRDHADKNGYVVVREYVDEAVSGRVDDRPEFNKMIDEARLPEASFREVLMDWTQSTRKTAVLVGGRIGYNFEPSQMDCGGIFPDMDRATTARGDDLLLNIDGTSVCLLSVQRVRPSSKSH